MVDASFENRLGEVLQRTGTRLGPEVARQLNALRQPAALAATAAVLVAWIVGHAFGVGEAIDLIVGVVGFIAIGWSVFDGLDELLQFGRKTYDAHRDADLDEAAAHLARAIGILGVQAVLALLMRGRPRTGRGAPLDPGPPPPRTPGWRYRPGTVGSAGEAAGTGGTTFWSDVSFSTLGTAEDQRLVLLHEKVHQFLAPKLYLLRALRVRGRVQSYFKSSLYRWFEEMLAETFARMRTLGYNPQQLWKGMSFPVKEGYVMLTRGGGYSPIMGGAGVLPEGGALLATGEAAGISWQAWFVPARPAQQVR